LKIAEETKLYDEMIQLKTNAEKVFTGFIVQQTDERISEQERMLASARKISAEMNAL
jgi:hypothetical protein